MRAITTALVVLLSVGTATAQPAPAAPQGRPAFELAQTAVTALTLAASIEQSIERIDRNRLGDQSGRFEATNEARRALGRSQEANSLLGEPIGFGEQPDPKGRNGNEGAFQPTGHRPQ